MDIPDTGAVFTLGKSYLIENNQSYFYIKNDPVKQISSNYCQSAVICESGRVFVWGENQSGQLGIGNSNQSEIITKPTCIKSFKALGIKIADIAFGIGWSAVLTQTNEIYFSGRNIFPDNSKIYKNFINQTESQEKLQLVKKHFHIQGFKDITEKLSIGNFMKISAGNDHFVVLSSNGTLFGYGQNSKNQLDSTGIAPPEPIKLNISEKVITITTGQTSTLILTDNGKLYITGKLNEAYFTQFTEISFNFPRHIISYIKISQTNEIFLVSQSGNIFKSIENHKLKNITFREFYDYDYEENGAVNKILIGNSFSAIHTITHKMFTTFSESGHHLKTFREITKLKALKITDITVGDNHILVLGIPRHNKKFDLNSSNLKIGDNNNDQYENSRDIVQNGIDNLIDKNKEININDNKNYSESKTIVSKTSNNKSYENESEQNVILINEKKSPSLSEKSHDSEKTCTTIVQNNIKETIIELDSPIQISDKKRPKSRLSSKNSERSLNFDQKSLKSLKSQDRLIRPQTPYPDSMKPTSTDNINSNTQINKTNESTLTDNLENIQENSIELIEKHQSKESYDIEKINSDIDLKKNISETHIIRFINDGVDVTSNILDTNENQSHPEIKSNIEDISEIIENEFNKGNQLHEEDERTTASINSNKINHQNGLINIENDKDNVITQNSKEINKDIGYVKKDRFRNFLDDIQTKGKSLTCQNCEIINIEDESTLNRNRENNRTSKVCAIL